MQDMNRLEYRSVGTEYRLLSATHPAEQRGPAGRMLVVIPEEVAE